MASDPSIPRLGAGHTGRLTKLLERTAARATFAFQMNKTVSAQAALALSGGRSAWSR